MRLWSVPTLVGVRPGRVSAHALRTPAFGADRSARRRPRAEAGKYVLAGLIRCGHCGKAMFGNTAKNKAYYRCAATRPDYAAASVSGHSGASMVREERVLAAVDRWLSLLATGENLDATVAAILEADNRSTDEPAEVAQARNRERRLGVELERVLAALRAGMDPALAASETRRIQAEMAGARSVVERRAQGCARPAPLEERDVRAVLGNARDLLTLLEAADRTERANLYQTLGLSLRYEKEAPTGRELVRARLELSGGGGWI